MITTGKIKKPTCITEQLREAMANHAEVFRNLHNPSSIDHVAFEIFQIELSMILRVHSGPNKFYERGYTPPSDYGYGKVSDMADAATQVLKEELQLVQQRYKYPRPRSFWADF